MKITYSTESIARLLTDLFIESHREESRRPLSLEIKQTDFYIPTPHEDYDEIN